MSDIQAIADRFEIGALRDEFTDAVMMHDYDCGATLFTEYSSHAWCGINTLISQLCTLINTNPCSGGHCAVISKVKARRRPSGDQVICQ